MFAFLWSDLLSNDDSQVGVLEGLTRVRRLDSRRGKL